MNNLIHLSLEKGLPELSATRATKLKEYSEALMAPSLEHILGTEKDKPCLLPAELVQIYLGAAFYVQSFHVCETPGEK